MLLNVMFKSIFTTYKKHLFTIFSFQFLVNTRNMLQDLFQRAAFRGNAAAVGITCRSCT